MNWLYPVLMGAAVATGVIVSRRTQQRLPLTRVERLAVGLGAFCGGMLGAKLPFVLLDPQGLLTGTAWFENGKTLVFGLVGGYFGVEVAKWSMDIRVRTGDSLAVPVAAAIAVGRLACFVGGCCFGAPTDLPWGIDFLGDGIRRHPTQIYECLFHLTAALVLARLQKAGRFRGQLVKLYILSYLVYRFLTEFIRPEPHWGDSVLSVYQWAVLGLLPVFAALWCLDSRRLTAPVPVAPAPPA